MVVAEVYQTVLAAERLRTDRSPDALLFCTSSTDSMIASFRAWVNGPAGAQLGLAPIPDGAVNLRMLRRRLAIELAYRPGGLLAAKVGLKQVSVATTEGYAATPGGAQAKLMAEVAAEEEQRNLQLLDQALTDYRNGIRPSGPGARELLQFLGTVDGALSLADAGAPAATTQQTVRAMLAKRAATLHLGVAN